MGIEEDLYMGKDNVISWLTFDNQIREKLKWHQDDLVDDQELGTGRSFVFKSLTLEVFLLKKAVRLKTPETDGFTTRADRFVVTNEGITFQRKLKDDQPELDIFIGKHGELAFLQGLPNEPLDPARIFTSEPPKTFPSATVELKAEAQPLDIAAR